MVSLGNKPDVGIREGKVNFHCFCHMKEKYVISTIRCADYEKLVYGIFRDRGKGVSSGFSVFKRVGVTTLIVLMAGIMIFAQARLGGFDIQL